MCKWINEWARFLFPTSWQDDRQQKVPLRCRWAVATWKLSGAVRGKMNPWRRLEAGSGSSCPGGHYLEISMLAAVSDIPKQEWKFFGNESSSVVNSWFPRKKINLHGHKRTTEPLGKNSLRLFLLQSLNKESWRDFAFRILHLEIKIKLKTLNLEQA